MSATAKYFKTQFKPNKFLLGYDNAPDFYLSCAQSNRSCLPLLCVRTLVFAGCLSVLLSSMILTGRLMHISFWFIYLTHWGLILITLTSGFAFLVSAVAYFKGPIDATFDLPWYVKTYWVVYNGTVPIAFFITVFYWIFLSEMGEEYAIDPILDVFIHAVNSLLMLVLLLVSRQPCHILHFIYPVLFGIVYLLFSLIYYFAGGLNPQGEAYVYPMLDWSNPGLAAITAVGSAVALMLVHLFVVGISALRDFATRRCRGNDSFYMPGYK